MPFVCHRSFVSFSFFSRIPSISALDPCHAMPGGFGALGVGQILKWSDNTLQYSLWPVYFERPPYKGDFHRNPAHSPTITGESRFGGWDPAEVSSIDVTWPTMPIRDRFTGRLGLWLSVFMKKNHVWSVRLRWHCKWLLDISSSWLCSGCKLDLIERRLEEIWFLRRATTRCHTDARCQMPGARWPHLW